MSMSFWVILSWVFVFILTAINVVVFMKLKQASDQMLKMAFPNAKNTGDAMAQMQNMMSGMQGMMGGAPGARPGARPGGNPFGGMPATQGGKQNMDAQLKAAMDMLNKMQKR